MSAEYNYNNIKVAVIGCGNWGKNLARVFHQLGALYAVCDTEPTKATTLSKKYNVPHASLEKLLINKEINAIAIATPSSTHYEIGMLCLKANKHLFIEKPLALKVKDAITLENQAKNQNRVLMVGHLLQYHGVFAAVKQLNMSGSLGKLQQIYSHRCNFGKYRTEESVLWDFTPHDISMILSLVGEMPYQVMATSANHLEHTVIDSVDIHLNFHGNIQAKCFASWIHPYKEQRLIVIGNKAMAVFDDCQPWESKLRLHHYPAEWNDGLPQPFHSQFENISLPITEPLFNECSHFLQCVANSALPITSGAEGINVITILEAATQSLTTQQCVSLPLPPTLPSKEFRKQADISPREELLVNY